jgi:hypothetical protein
MTVTQNASDCKQAKLNSVAVRTCSEKVSGILAGDARSIAGKAHSSESAKRRIVGRRAKRDITGQTHKRRRHHDDCVSGCVDLCECCAWECLYHAMRALHKPAGLGMERQNREFLSLPVVLCSIRIFPLFRLCRRGEKRKGEEETYYRDIH